MLHKETRRDGSRGRASETVLAAKQNGSEYSTLPADLNGRAAHYVARRYRVAPHLAQLIARLAGIGGAA